ncbi:MAG: hypothetical protein IPM97_01425 [Bdellovibrionaceae bacterium]|nr:hypothetical protein [Pseudobdellovibrionaceae bacterium]
MKKLFFGLGIILAASNSFAVECSILVGDGAYTVYRGVTRVQDFSNLAQAIKLRDEFVEKKWCQIPAKTPECPIHVADGAFLLYLGDSLVMGFPNFKDAFELQTTLIDKKICSGYLDRHR